MFKISLLNCLRFSQSSESLGFDAGLGIFQEFPKGLLNVASCFLRTLTLLLALIRLRCCGRLFDVFWVLLDEKCPLRGAIKPDPP